MFRKGCNTIYSKVMCTTASKHAIIVFTVSSQLKLLVLTLSCLSCVDKCAAYQAIVVDLQAADEPVWQYVDPENNTQGPFTAKEMHSWLKGNYLQQELLVCGMVSCQSK